MLPNTSVEEARRLWDRVQRRACDAPISVGGESVHIRLGGWVIPLADRHADAATTLAERGVVSRP